MTSSRLKSNNSFRLAIRCLALAAVVVLSVPGVSHAIILEHEGMHNHVFDTTRNLLYISANSGQLLRYDLQSMSFLTPLAVGGSLRGMDISPDGNFLYAADHTPSDTRSFVRKVNLNTLAVTSLGFFHDTNERGTEDVKIASNGIALVTSSFDGSSGVPLHQIDTSTGIITQRADALERLTESKTPVTFTDRRIEAQF